MDRLHWSLDYGHQFGADDFRGELIALLTEGLTAPRPDAGVKRKIDSFTILPNFCASYNRKGSEGSLQIGGLELERELAGSTWTYDVEHRNDLSGENLVFTFSCANDSTRSLESGWRIQDKNSADGSFSGIDWTGRFVRYGAARRIVLETSQGLTVEAGQIDSDVPLTCNWSILDRLTELHGEAVAGIAILNDLETLHLDCHIHPFDEWHVELDGRHHDLQGYVVFGTGMPPTYWWVGNGAVVAFATTLTTFVLTGREAR